MIHHRIEAQYTEPSGEEGGYLASVADLMIGLLFVFILLVVVLAAAQREEQSRAESEQATAQQQFQRDRQAILDRAQRDRDLILGASDPRGLVTALIGDAVRQVVPNVRVDTASGVISLSNDSLFAIGQDQLLPGGESDLQKVAQALAEVLPCFVGHQALSQACADNPSGHSIETIFIEGHTDSRPVTSRRGDNFDLSLARARTVHGVLVSNTTLLGLRNNLDQPLFSFSAYADTRPVPGSNPLDDINRRVDFRIVLSYRSLTEVLNELDGAVNAVRQAPAVRTP